MRYWLFDWFLLNALHLELNFLADTLTPVYDGVHVCFPSVVPSIFMYSKNISNAQHLKPIFLDDTLTLLCDGMYVCFPSVILSIFIYSESITNALHIKPIFLANTLTMVYTFVSLQMLSVYMYIYSESIVSYFICIRWLYQPNTIKKRLLNDVCLILAVFNYLTNQFAWNLSIP